MSGFMKKQLYNRFDGNRDGYVTFPEFMMALRRFGNINPMVMQPLFQMADRDGNGAIEYREFERLMHQARSMFGGGGSYPMSGGGYPMGGMGGGGYPMGGMGGGGYPMGGMGGYPMGGMGGGFGY